MNWFHLILSFLFTFLGVFTNAQKSYNILMDQGNTLFKQEKYDAATSKFLEAQKLKKDDFSASFNSANSLYKSKKYEEAKAQLEHAEKNAHNKAEKAALYHNLGNTYMQLNDPSKAAEFYKKSLKLEPHNEDTRRNFEIAKQKEKNKQNNKNNNQKKDENGNGNKNSENPNKENKKGDPPKNEDKENGNTPNQGNGLNNKKPQTPKEDQNKIPKDIKNAILENISEREKETARRILNKNSYYMPESREKDW